MMDFFFFFFISAFSGAPPVQTRNNIRRQKNNEYYNTEITKLIRQPNLYASMRKMMEKQEKHLLLNT
jgi:hypothetical protein